MRKNLQRFYETFGDRGVMFLIYAAFVVMHAVLSVQMELPSVHPDEIGVSSIAAYFSGRDWSGVMDELEFYYGYIQAVFYIPLFLLFSGSPLALYKSMLMMNGVLISFVPVIVYHLCAKLGVEKVWQKLFAAVSCGCYITYIAHTKFVWNEAICSLLPWLLMWCVFMAWDSQRRYSRFIYSVFSGLLCAVCYAAHQRLLAVVIALVLTVIISAVFFKQTLVNIPAFSLAAVAGFVGEYFATRQITQAVWGGEVISNTVSGEIYRVGSLAQPGGFSGFVGTLFGHLYTFMTSTFGIGALAAVLLVCLAAGSVKDAWFNRKRQKLSKEDGTREYVPVQSTYSDRMTIAAIYGFLCIGGSLLVSVLFKLGSDKSETIMDLAIFGRYTDNVAPMAIFTALVFIFLYGLKLRHVFCAAGLYGAVCLLFGLTGYNMVVGADIYRESPILGLLPLRIGEDITCALTGMSFVIMSSCVFAVFAVMIVMISCSRRHGTNLISGIICAAFVSTAVFAGGTYLPIRVEENEAKTAPAEQICRYLYNDAQSPVIVAYLIPSRTAALIQFMNPETEVLIVKDKKNIPDNCILVTETSRNVPFPIGSFDYVGKTDRYSIYACGEGARDFIRYKESS